VSVTSREAIAATMVVLRDPGEVFVLRHTAGPDAVSWVERVDPVTLETRARSRDLAGGPTWPGGLAAHADGSLYVVFGAHAHRLDADLEVTASIRLPRHRPYNSFVVLPDGRLATKDFGGVLPGQDPAEHRAEPAELLVLDTDLSIIDRAVLPEPSIARLSADGSTIYVVGTSTLHRATWDGRSLVVDDGFAARYRTIVGQTYGWDAVLALGAAWFLDNGEGSERYSGTFRGQGISSAPLHLVRVDLATGATTLTEICGLPDGVVANPPCVDEQRRIVVGYDSGNGVLVAFDVADDGSAHVRWRREQDHASHLLLFADSGELVTNDHDGERMADQIVVLDIETGAERVRVDAQSPVQSVLFPAVGWDRDVYYCSFASLTRLATTG
jgi:sugar lactone lactonase YvrE